MEVIALTALGVFALISGLAIYSAVVMGKRGDCLTLRIEKREGLSQITSVHFPEDVFRS